MDSEFINGLHTGLSFQSLLTYGSQINQDPMVPSPQTVEKSKKKRQKLSDKTRSLHKLLPFGKKSDMATVLEESYKYIKFLDAQVRVLESMPRVSGEGVGFGGVGESDDLGRLNRQELLRVVVNSEKAQSVLCDNQCCVYSVEQLFTLNNTVKDVVVNKSDDKIGEEEF